MPAPKKYHEDAPATGAERQRKYNEKLRQAERERLAAEAAKRERIALGEERARKALGKMLKDMKWQELQERLRLTGIELDPEYNSPAYVWKVAEALERGRQHLP